MAKRQTRVLCARCALFAYLLLPVIWATRNPLSATSEAPLAIQRAWRFRKRGYAPQCGREYHPLRDHRRQRQLPVRKPEAWQLHLTASKEGFSASPTTSVELVARQSARVDLPLSLAQVQQSVKVEAAAEQINTENATVGDTRGNRPVGRDAAQFQSADHQSAGCPGAFSEHHHR